MLLSEPNELLRKKLGTNVNRYSIATMSFGWFSSTFIKLVWHSNFRITEANVSAKLLIKVDV